jgi:hypothetical protein
MEPSENTRTPLLTRIGVSDIPTENPPRYEGLNNAQPTTSRPQNKLKPQCNDAVPMYTRHSDYFYTHKDETHTKQLNGTLKNLDTCPRIYFRRRRERCVEVFLLTP